MKYIASCSFGKDSLASIILAHEHGDPLDEVVYVEVMFDKNISGEIPEHRDFVYDVAMPKLENWGYKVTILRSDMTYLDNFYTERIKGKHIGMRRGFPHPKRCEVRRDCKLRAIKRYMKHQPKDVIQYIGIASDESHRFNNLDDNHISLLLRYHYTEEMAKQLCEDYGLLSPIYIFSKRNGCFFCPNAKKPELRHLRDYHPELWDSLLRLEREKNLAVSIWNIMKKVSLNDKEDQFFWEDKQINFDDYFWRNDEKENS